MLQFSGRAYNFRQAVMQVHELHLRIVEKRGVGEHHSPDFVPQSCPRSIERAGTPLQ